MGDLTLLCGDCLELLPTLAADSVDSIVTDPPYGLSSMGKDWDHGVPGEAFWRAALRVAKPGAHMLAFGGTRTFHRLACAIEDAGWEIRDTIMWVYGSGFPKSLDVSKTIDKAAGAEREDASAGGHMGYATSAGDKSNGNELGTSVPHVINKGAHTRGTPATLDAARWQGWGTALKPAWEPIIVARKPLAGTVAANVLAWGTGAINVDACRVETDEPIPVMKSSGGRKFEQTHTQPDRRNRQIGLQTLGRWPANVIHDGSDEVLAGFPVTTSGGGNKTVNGPYTSERTWNVSSTPGNDKRFEIDTGSAARFFYCAKASKADRDEGCEGLAERINPKHGHGNNETDPFTASHQPIQRNHHPTVKPTALMRYLVRLVTPPGGVVLDPFMGSGSTGKAAVLEGFGFIGMDLEAEYVEIARRRMAAAQLPLLEGMSDG